uniref:histidine--tRNA ligase n=1 Tax=Hyaloperonospora arabidopsidis (strain Emoy2) TaxID=559515 RepID=M4BJQ0_HYAAE
MARMSTACRWLTTNSKSKQINRVRGTRDVQVDELQHHREVLQVLQQTVEGYGFRSIQTPLLEYTDLFSRSLGDGSDIIQKEMYTFEDKSGKSVTLRPEGTAGIVRALISNNLLFSLPQKLSYSGSMFRCGICGLVRPISRCRGTTSLHSNDIVCTTRKSRRSRRLTVTRFWHDSRARYRAALDLPTEPTSSVDRLSLLREMPTKTVFSVAVVPILVGDSSNRVLHEAMRIAKTAERYGSSYAVILGEAEISKQRVKVKNLEKREETEVPMDQLSSFKFLG